MWHCNAGFILHASVVMRRKCQETSATPLPGAGSRSPATCPLRSSAWLSKLCRSPLALLPPPARAHVRSLSPSLARWLAYRCQHVPSLPRRLHKHWPVSSRLLRSGARQISRLNSHIAARTHTGRHQHTMDHTGGRSPWHEQAVAPGQCKSDRKHGGEQELAPGNVRSEAMRQYRGGAG